MQIAESTCNRVPSLSSLPFSFNLSPVDLSHLPPKPPLNFLPPEVKHSLSLDFAFISCFYFGRVSVFNGSSVRPRLSVFCSNKQLYAMLVDDQNKKCLFYGSTLQKSIRENSSCSTIETAQRVGEELVKACVDLKINEISSYDRNGFSRGERMEAFEIAMESEL
ncbi:uncharacterized protein LOC143857618 [Tasmannia lanceolata]|uniref:uncharacterized protein LOC143857618 n=1 Tax=Tasmannia lanceolata TaxID=3420 RepID=UPI0040631ACB